MPGLKYRRKGVHNSYARELVVLMLSYKRHETIKREFIRSQIWGNLKIIKSLFTSSTKQIFLADHIGQIGCAYLSSALLPQLGGQVL